MVRLPKRRGRIAVTGRLARRMLLITAVALLASACGGKEPVVTVPPDQATSKKRSAPRRATPARPRFFAPHSFWNAPLAPDAPIDPRSRRLVAELVRLVKRDVDAERGPWINTKRSSTPLYTVPRHQREVRVHLDSVIPGGPYKAFSAVPLPDHAEPGKGVDGMLTVWQPSTGRLWEFFQLTRRADGWHARWGGAMTNVSTSPGYYTPQSWPGGRSYWGSSASSLPVVGGTILMAEARRGRIDHALSIALPEVRAGEFAWPAQRSDGRTYSRDAIPEGARFRLDPKLDLDRLDLSPIVRMIAEAAQRYGLVVRDKSEGVVFYGETPTEDTNPWPAIYGRRPPLNAQLERFPWDRLQLLKMRLCTRTQLRRQGRQTGQLYGVCRRR